MIIRTVLPILILVIPLAADTLGDFAPLEIGNRWQYAVTSYGWETPERRYFDTVTTTIQIIDKETAGDTTIYFLRASTEGFRSFGNAVDGTPVPPAIISKVRFDTLLEVADSIFHSIQWANSFPVWERHFYTDSADLINDSPFRPTDSLRLIEGKYQFTATTQLIGGGPSQIHDEVMKYREDVGLIYYDSFGLSHQYNSGTTMTLTSFSNESVHAIPVETAPVSRSLSSSPIIQRRLSFSGVSISIRHSTFNLLGRHTDGTGMNNIRLKVRTTR